MKASNKIMFITGLVIVAILLASVIGSRIFLNKFSNTYISENPNYSIFDTEYKDIIDFSSLDVSGDWDIALIYGTSYKISINGRAGIENPYEIEQKGTTLFLTENDQPGINKKLNVKITIPEIKELNSNGGIKLELNGFEDKELKLNFNGGAWITGNNCEFENLLLSSAGAINLGFENITTVNADIQLSGAGNILLNMAGGLLSGNASGAVNIEYLGTAQENISAGGLVSIGRRNN